MPPSITDERDYLEIVSGGDITISTSATVDADAEFPSTVYNGTNYGVATITHNLGSVPFVRAYYDPDINGKWYSTRRINGTGYGQFDEPWLTVVNTTTTTKLIINSGSAESNIPVHYRIYRFGTKSISSDERIDKIFLSSGTTPLAINLGAAANSVTPQFTTVTIPHGAGVPVLATLQFSEDAVTWYSGGVANFGSPDTGSGPPGGPYAFYYYTTAYAYSDATNCYIFAQHNYASSKTIYVRYALDLKS